VRSGCQDVLNPAPAEASEGGRGAGPLGGALRAVQQRWEDGRRGAAQVSADGTGRQHVHRGGRQALDGANPQGEQRAFEHLLQSDVHPGFHPHRFLQLLAQPQAQFVSPHRCKIWVPPSPARFALLGLFWVNLIFVGYT
jgi:hypothetical protein